MALTRRRRRGRPRAASGRAWPRESARKSAPAAPPQNEQRSRRASSRRRCCARCQRRRAPARHRSRGQRVSEIQQTWVARAQSKSRTGASGLARFVATAGAASAAACGIAWKSECCLAPAGSSSRSPWSWCRAAAGWPRAEAQTWAAAALAQAPRPPRAARAAAAQRCRRTSACSDCSSAAASCAPPKEPTRRRLPHQLRPRPAARPEAAHLRHRPSWRERALRRASRRRRRRAGRRGRLRTPCAGLAATAMATAAPQQRQPQPWPPWQRRQQLQPFPTQPAHSIASASCTYARCAIHTCARSSSARSFSWTAASARATAAESSVRSLDASEASARAASSASSSCFFWPASSRFCAPTAASAAACGDAGDKSQRVVRKQCKSGIAHRALKCRLEQRGRRRLCSSGSFRARLVRGGLPLGALRL